ncbi:MAG: hypothetical protein LQ338_006888 [Usnochroma carphineum]|nr:MAG: hypothetical protein LQ338_006888 [Usnochroma carphineum]
MSQKLPLPFSSRYEKPDMRGFQCLTLSSVSSEQYRKLLKSEHVFIGIPRPTPDQMNAVLDVRYEARERLGHGTTTEDIIGELLAMKRAVIQAIDVTGSGNQHLYGTLRYINTAINDEMDQDRRYQDDMRRFLKIVVMKMEEAPLPTDPDLSPSLEHLVMETGPELGLIPASQIGNRNQVLGRLRRHWRWLGLEASVPYEPLFERVIGRPFINE